MYEQTPEQLQNVINATGQTPVGYTINSSTLAPTPSSSYISPKATPIYPVASLLPQAPAPLTATPTEAKANDLTSELSRLNESFTGQSAYRTEQENLQDIQGKQNTVKDLTSRLTALKNEALAIPLQIQNANTGTGATQAGLQPHQTAALRNNAIQALSVNSLIEAANGNLTTALDMVDRAVAQKFDPIKEQIQAKLSNFDLIIKSPQYSLEQQNRAQQQKAIQEARAAEIQAQEQSQKEIYTLAVQAAQAGGDPLTISRIQSAGSRDEALQIAVQAGLAAAPTDQPASVQEYEYAKRNGYKGSFSDYQNEDANRKRSIAAAGVANASGMTPNQVSVFNRIVDKYNASPLVAANDRASILRDVTNAVAADPGNASLQVSFIYSMIQALDTYQSAVREGEIGLISSTQGLGDKIANLPSKIANGTPLSASKVQEYVATAKLLTDSIANAAKKKQKSFSSQAGLAGVGNQFNQFVSTTSVGGSAPTPIPSPSKPASSGGSYQDYLKAIGK